MTSHPHSFSFFRKKCIVRRRAGVSPVIATTIIIAITVVMGLALYSYANSQTGVASKSFADEATDYINLKNDRFSITGLAYYTNTDSEQFTAYIFNSGNRQLQIASATLTTVSSSSTTSSFCTDDATIESKELKGIVFEPCPDSVFSGFDPSTPTVYQVKITTVNGASQTYFQKYGGA